jgi:hypothetical protein
MEKASNEKLGLVLAFALLFGLPVAASENLGDLKLSSAATRLLEGRLTARFPAAARTEPIRPGIMSAPTAEAEETRVVIDAGSQRLVVMAYETFALAGENFEDDIGKKLNTDSVKSAVHPWPVPPPLRAYAFSPDAPTKNKAANLVMGLYVIRPDRTIQMLEAYVNPEGASDFPRISGLVKAIFGTVAAGRKELNRAGGDRELWPSTFITLPSDYVITVQNATDFVVYHVRKLAIFGKPAMSIGVYFGDHPSQDGRYSRKETLKLFGKSVDWREKVEKTEKGALIVLADALVPLHAKDLPSYADVFSKAGDAGGMQELRKIAATLRIGANGSGHR